MSHFTVLVISPSDNLEDPLAPFFEQGEEDDWFMDEVREPVELDKARNYIDTLRNDPDGDPSGKEGLPAPDADDRTVAEWYHGDDVQEIDGELFTVYRSNRSVEGPNGGDVKGAKWDWWSLGGRWSGQLALKSTLVIKEPVGVAATGGTPEMILPETGRMGERGLMDDRTNEDPEFFGKADQAQKKDIDIEGMRNRAEALAHEHFTTYESIVNQHGPLPSTDWHDLPGGRTNPEFEEARKAYWDHPTIKALQAAKLIGFMGDPEELNVTREEYVERARLQAVPGYAVLDAYTGEWYEPGSMGWFGMSSETPESRLEYLRKVNKIIDDAPEDAWISMVDCHI